MSTPTPNMAAQLITYAEQKQQRKQIIAQSYLLLKDPAKMDSFLEDLIGWMEGDGAAGLKAKHKLALLPDAYTNYDQLKAEFDAIDAAAAAAAAAASSTPDQIKAQKKAYLTQYLYDFFHDSVVYYANLKAVTETDKKNLRKKDPSKTSGLQATFSNLLNRLPGKNDSNYPQNIDDITALVKTLDSDPELSAFLKQRVERAGAGEPDESNLSEDPTVKLGNKFYREYQQRKGASPNDPFLEELGKKAETAMMIRGTKDPTSGEWSRKLDPDRSTLSFIERRKGYKPTGRPHATAINLIVAREIGFSTQEVIDFINGGADIITSTTPADGEKNPCIIKFTDSKTQYRLLAKEEFGQIIPYKINEKDYDDWKQAGSNLTDSRITKMSGDDCVCKIVGNNSNRTAADDFAEMFVALADLNRKNVHTNIDAPPAIVPPAPAPAAGLKITPAGNETNLISSISGNKTLKSS